MAFGGMSCTVLLLVVLGACVDARTFYEVLGVEKNATPRELKKGYMKQVLKYHPDKNDAPNATEKFIEVTTAYECLGDPELRKKYDSIGHNAYVSTKQKKEPKRSQEERDDSFSKFESFFRKEQKSSYNSDGDDDEFFKSFFSEFEDIFESRGFNDDGGVFYKRKTVQSSGNGGIKMEMDGFLHMDDILFDPLWNTESEDDPTHFGSGRSFFGEGHFEPPTDHAFFDTPHSFAHSSHARAHAHAHQQHHNFHHQHHHNFHHQHTHQSSRQQHHPNHFHQQHEFKFFTSNDASEEDVFDKDVFGSPNMFSDSSFGSKEFSYESSSSASTGGANGGYIFESTHSMTGSLNGERKACKVSRRTDSMGNVVESKSCS